MKAFFFLYILLSLPVQAGHIFSKEKGPFWIKQEQNSAKQVRFFDCKYKSCTPIGPSRFISLEEFRAQRKKEYFQTGVSLAGDVALILAGFGTGAIASYALEPILEEMVSGEILETSLASTGAISMSLPLNLMENPLNFAGQWTQATLIDEPVLSKRVFIVPTQHDVYLLTELLRDVMEKFEE